MRVIWIVLITFTIAFLAPGNSLPSRYPKEANIFPVFSSVSVEHRPDRTTDDFTGTGSYANDKPSYNPLYRGTQKGIIRNKDLFTSTELSKLFNSINVGKHLSKKVAHLLKSRPGLLASLSKALQDVGYRSSKVRDAHLHGSPMSIHGTTVKLTNQSPEMDDQVIKGSPELKSAGTMSYKTSEADNQEILPKASLDHKKAVEQGRQTKEPYSGKKLDSFKSTPDVFKLGSGEPRHKWGSKPEDMDPGSEEDKLTASESEWDSGPPEDIDPESETDELSGSGTDGDSGALEDMNPESETDELSRSGTDWDSGAPEDMDPELETDELSRSGTDWDSGTLEDMDPESETDELSGSGTDWDSGTPEDMDPESETDKLSESDAGWDSGAPEDMDPESEKDELSGSEEQSGSDPDRDSGASEDKDLEAKTEEQSGSDPDWDSGAPEDMDLEAQTDEQSGSDTELDSGVSDDTDLEAQTQQQSVSDTDWDSGAPEDMDLEAQTEEQSGSDTDWKSGAPEDMDLEAQTEEQSGSDTEWDSSAPEDMDPGSEKEQLLGSDNEWDSGVPEDMDPESETEEQSGSDTDWDPGKPEDMDPGSEKEKLSGSDNEWDSGASEDMDPESETEGQSGSDTEWDSGKPEDMDPGSEGVTLSASGVEWGSGAPEDVKPGSDTESIKKVHMDMKLALERLLSKSSRNISPRKSTDAEGTAFEEETARSSPKGKRYASEFTKDFEFDNSESESSPEPFTPPVSDIRWSGTSLADSRSFDDVLSADEGKGTKKQNGGGISIAFVTVLVLGGLFFLLLMVAFFVFAWPIRKYYKEKCRQMSKKDVESGQDDNDELTSIRVDGSHHTDCESTPYCPPLQPPQQEPSSAPYNAPVVEQLVVATTGNMLVGNGQASYSGVPQAAQSRAKSTIEVLVDDWLRDSRNVERRKIIKRQSFEKRHSLADSLLIAKSVIDGHAKNKQFEKKASERRRVIKCCGSAPGSLTGERRMSFADELQAARSVIVPTWDYKESLEKSKEKCRTIKDTFAGKRRPSLLEEIGFAKDVIVDSERRKYELPPAIVEEMLIAHIAPGGPMKYYGDVLDKLIRENSEMERMRAYRNIPPTSAAEQQSMVENEVLWNGDSF